MASVPYEAFESAYKDHGPLGLWKFVTEGLKRKDFKPEDVSLRSLAWVCGALSPYDMEGSLRRTMRCSRDTEKFPVEFQVKEQQEIWQRKAAGEFLAYEAMHSNLFPVLTNELLANAVLEGYNVTGDFIGDSLVTTLPGQNRRNQKIPGVTALGETKEVREGFPYEETGFDEKYVTTSEMKKGRILSITEELIMFDQTALVMQLARELGEYAKQERERTIVRGVIDADSSTRPVYRPSGVGEPLYATDGSNRNYIGSGNTTSTSYNAAVALTNWKNLESVRAYRATEVVDDRVDGTARHIVIPNGNLTMLVPQAKFGLASTIRNATGVADRGANSSAATEFMYANPAASLIGNVLTSSYIDAEGGQNVNDWYVGDFKKQFYWTEIWPLQTFMQGADSESAFERDVTMRVKVRYYGGISAREPFYVTKVDGA